MNKRRLGKYEYPEENFNEYPDAYWDETELKVIWGNPVPFEGHPNRLIRDRVSRPRLDFEKHEDIGGFCPDCGSKMLDTYRNHYGCENCPYVAWGQELKEREG